MAGGYRQYQSTWVLVLLLLVGALVGNALAAMLAPVVPFLKASYTIGLQPATLDLQLFRVTFGFNLTLGPLTALGLIFGYLLYRKL
ncbi:hypothetical protein A6M21_05400 [Desulfotomaculum copahuensis]|uniref:DUF4321 domain-containing protein n=2 Tax=Desulfotomaculum copahuensis TaxID=1838280 RepID=A0A1B7LH94_9FIRM|nr:hypothetical protein A6M21_05400 [Desulfotomaculum copahuensis]